jgi:hypothetical protein
MTAPAVSPEPVEAVRAKAVLRRRRIPIEDLIVNRRWVRRTEPFPHVVAQNVFTTDFYAALHAEFVRIEHEHPEAFQRQIANYDAAAADVERYRDGPLGVFVSREWHDLIQGVAGISATGDVVASLHHHDPGSRRGWPHNDLNPGWFGASPAGDGEVRTESSSPVSYRDGRRPDGVDARACVRGVSVLFYLGNGPWSPGDGGETGLFSSYQSERVGPAAVVPPIDNSLVLFECTPFSLHAFLGTAKPRNSVVMWLHRSKDEAVKRWGENSIVHW